MKEERGGLDRFGHAEDLFTSLLSQIVSPIGTPLIANHLSFIWITFWHIYLLLHCLRHTLLAEINSNVNYTCNISEATSNEKRFNKNDDLE